MSTLFGKRAERFLSVMLSVTMIVWTLGVVAFTPVAAATLNEGDIIRGPDGIKVYIINATGYKRHIFNPEVFNMYAHLKWENIKAVDQTTLDSYKTSDIYRADGDSKVYQTAEDGMKRWFDVTAAEFGAKYSWDQVFVVNPVERDYYSTGSVINAAEVAGTTTTTTATGALNVSVASDPIAGTLVADSTASSTEGAQALAPVMKLNFSGAGKVTSLKIHRQGISADSDVSNMYLYDGDAYLADSPIVSNNYFTFTNSAGLFTVSGSKTITVKMDVAEDVTSGKTLQFGIVAAGDIASDATSLGGSFPMHGNVFTTATVTDLGKITLAHVSDPGTSIDAGLTEQEVWRFSLASADQKIKISSIKVTAIGTLNAGDLTNFKLHDGTSQIGSTIASMNSDKTVTFDLSVAPYEIASGLTKNISLKADIVAGSSRNFYFEIATGRDLVAMDGNYNVYLKVNKSDTYSIIKAASTTTINQGTISISRATDAPSGNVAKDATNVIIGKWNFKASGEAIKINQFVITTTVGGSTASSGGATYNAQGLNDGKLILDGVQVGTTKDLVTSTSGGDTAAFTFGGSFIVNAGQTRTLELKSDVKMADGTLFGSTTTATILAAIKADSIDAIRQSSGTGITTNNATNGAGAALSVSSAAVSAAKNATLANMSVVAGSNGVTIGSFLLTAGAAEAVDVNTIVLKDNDDGTTVFSTDNNGAETWGDAFNNLKLYSGSTQLASTITSPTATGDAVAQTFNLSTPLRIAAGQSVQIDLVADVITGASWTTDFVGITSITGTGVTTNASVLSSTAVAGQTIAVASAGTLTVAVAATPTNPNTAYMVSGDTAQTVAAWKLSADNIEDMKVTRIKVKQVQADTDAPKNTKNLKLYVGSGQVGSTVPALTDPDATASTDEYAIFEDTNGLFTIPKNGSTTVTLKVDITDSSNAAFTNNGEQFKFRISTPASVTATADISAKGSLSNQYVSLASASTNYTANSQVVVSTKPTFALASGSPTILSTGNIEVMRFTVTAHSADDVVFNGAAAGGTITFSITGSATGTTTGRTADLYDYTTGTTVATQLTSQNNGSGQTLIFVDVSSTVAAGTSKTYYLKTDMGGYTGQFDSARFSINNTSAHVKWSDGTYTNAIDGTIVGFGLPLDGNTLTR